MVCQTAYQRVRGVIRVITNAARSAGREAATQARVATSYQKKAAHTERLAAESGAEGHEGVIRERR
eukprot:11217477-Lingulodinium_polyedra.AAC.1